MRSGTSFFDLTLYRKTLTRFWPLWAANLVFWFLLIPFQALMALGDDWETPPRSLLRFARNLGGYSEELGVIFALLAGLVVAMAVCSHLYNNRSANFVGALPVRREGQFISIWLAGLTILVAPNAAVFLFALLIEAVGGAVVLPSLLFWLAALSAMELFFYCFAVCIGQFTGHILALPVYYGVFNGIVAAVYLLLTWVFQSFYFGYVNTAGGEWIQWFTPVMAFIQMDCNVFEQAGPGSYMVAGTSLTVDIEGLWIAGVYAVAAVVLAVCALLLYRRRHLESAGDIVAVKAMRPVFKYGVAICAGLFIGLLTTEAFGLSLLGLMLSIIVWGLVGYFVAQMLLDKTFRVFRKWKGAAAVTVVFVLLFLAVGLDVTGYESRVPEASRVESVEISGLGGYPQDSGAWLTGVVLTEPEDVENVIALHRQIVEFGEGGENGGTVYHQSFRVRYTLTGGQVLERSYYVPFGDVLTGLGQNLRDSHEVRVQACRLDEVEALQGRGGWLASADLWRLDDYGGYDREIQFAPLHSERLWNAVMADFEAGRIGVTELEKAGYVEKDLYDQMPRLEFHWTERVLIDYQDRESGEGIYESRSVYLEFSVPATATETWKVLNELFMPDNRYQDNPDDNPLWRTEG